MWARVGLWELDKCNNDGLEWLGWAKQKDSGCDVRRPIWRDARSVVRYSFPQQGGYFDAAGQSYLFYGLANIVMLVKYTIFFVTKPRTFSIMVENVLYQASKLNWNNCSQRFELKSISNDKYVIFSKQTNNMEIDILKTDLYLNSPLPVRFRTSEII